MDFREYPRSFVATDDDLADWAVIEPYFKTLGDAPLETRDQLETWLSQCSELTGCIDQERASREVAMTQATDDEAREKRFLDFVRNIQPRLKPAAFALQKKYTLSPARKTLDSTRYQVLDRSMVNEVELFREQNVPLETEEEVLQQQYQKICGTMTVTYREKEYTLQQLAPFLLENDRAVRQEVWELSARRRFQDRDAIEDLFDKLVQLRHRMARNAGFDNYVDYGFRRKERFDYSIDDCRAFHDAIAECCVPLMREIQKQRQTRLGVDTLRPWDTSVDVKGRPPGRESRLRLHRRTDRSDQRGDPGQGAGAAGLQRW